MSKYVAFHFRENKDMNKRIRNEGIFQTLDWHSFMKFSVSLVDVNSCKPGDFCLIFAYFPWKRVMRLAHVGWARK